MNSYQTVNAAFAESGLSKQEAVKFGRAHEQGLHVNVTSLRDLFKAAMFNASYGRSTSSVSGYDEVVRIGRWNDEDKTRQLRLKGAGGIAAARAGAGGTSEPTYMVRAVMNLDGTFYEVYRPREPGYTSTRFRQHRWARVAADAWNRDMSVAAYGRARQIDVNGFTLA